jgi:hypothetical protein
VLGVSDMWSIEDIKGLFVVAGSVAGGCLGGDASWSIDGMIAVSVSESYALILAAILIVAFAL